MATEAASYEERRMQRLEENNKRMKQLNLHNLYQALKPSPNERNKPKADPGVAAPKIPTPFCKIHLIDYEVMLTLVDEDGVECQTKYHLRYNGLGAGWTGFFTNHDLVEGDTLVFQLVEPATF